VIRYRTSDGKTIKERQIEGATTERRSFDEVSYKKSMSGNNMQ